MGLAVSDVKRVRNDGDDSPEERHRLRRDRVRLEVVEFRQSFGLQKLVRRHALFPGKIVKFTVGIVLEADCSLTPHIVEHLVDHIDLRQFAKLNEKTRLL